MKNTIKQRVVDAVSEQSLIESGISPLFSKLYASRGIKSAAELDYDLSGMLPVSALLNADKAASILADAIEKKAHIVVSCDFDVDGCCAGAVAIKSLRAMGAHVDFAMPDRKIHGYGLSPLLVSWIKERFSPDLILTVDCGISSHAGIQAANEFGMSVVVTDHHLCAADAGLPDAACIVNPNQPGCQFPSKHLAGVGVIFYVMLALRLEMRERGAFKTIKEPNLANLLDLVALATIADVVKLDHNNRILVQQGIKRIREGKACYGINALFEAAGKSTGAATVFDFGFIIGPRINAAGRLEDASLGVWCLISDDYEFSAVAARRLDALNRERREIEAQMKESAEIEMDEMDVSGKYSLALFNEGWHQGVIGILSSRLKDAYGLPTITFADGGEGKLKGSGRSIPGLHLRDALDLVSKRHPGLLPTFGGHAMAAGMTCVKERFDEFVGAFEQVCRELLTPDDLQQVIETDGSLDADEISFETIQNIDDAIWGQGFQSPLFEGDFEILEQTVMKEKHMKLKVSLGGEEFQAVWFFHNESLPQNATLAYSMSVNKFRDTKTLQLMIRHARPAAN